MPGYIVLEGGAEFGGQMAEPDLRALTLAGGLQSPVSIIPTAAAPDNNHQRAGRNGVNWFHGLGASAVTSLPLIDKNSANDASIAAALRQSRLIYLLGGFTGYLGQTLQDSLAWQAILEAYEQGAVIAGSSAGAMVLCQYYYDPGQKNVVSGLNLVPNACVLPHHNTFGKNWAPQLSVQLPGIVLIGIDERTGMINDGPSSSPWQAYGKGAITLYSQGQTSLYQKGRPFSLPIM